MKSVATIRPPLLERHSFWTSVVVVMVFLGGMGLGMRLAVHGIRWNLSQSSDTAPTQAEMLSATVEGEVVGEIDVLNEQDLILRLADDSTTALQLNSSTSIFTYAGEQTPLLPGEDREKVDLVLADLQANDMVVVRYGSVGGTTMALSIQKIR